MARAPRHRSPAGRHPSLPEGKLEQVRAKCEPNSKPFEYASCSMRSRMSRPRVVRLKLNRVQDSGTIEAHISRSHYDRLGITKGQRVFVSPTNVRALAEPC